MNLSFTEKDLEVFSKISFDVNSLHCDSKYAHRSQFGERVVFGVAVACRALGAWSQGRVFRLEKLDIQFNRPHFLDQNYHLVMDEKGHDVVLRVQKGTSVCTLLKFTWSEWDGVAAPIKEFEQIEVRGAPAEVPIEMAGEKSNYWLNESLLKAFRDCFLLDGRVFPLEQLNILLWSSYFVGMQVPGKQALYSELHVVFRESTGPQHFNIFSNLNSSKHRVFNQWRIDAKNEASESIKIKAFERPEVSEISIDQIKEEFMGEEFSGKSVFITGAARGFGRLLACSVAAQGGQVFFNFRRNSSWADQTATEIKSLNQKSDAIISDLSDPASQEYVVEKLSAHKARIDCVFFNASPHISVGKWSSLSSKEILKFVQDSIACVENPLRALIPFLAPMAQLVLVSSVRANDVVPEFSHYTMAKRGLEGYWDVLAAEQKSFRFYALRPGMMKTDQTNIPVATSAVLELQDVAASSFEVLKKSPDKGMVLTVDFR